MFNNLETQLNVKKVALSEMYPVTQLFKSYKLKNIEERIQTQFEEELIQSKVKLGSSVAIAVGSRGIAQLKKIVSVVIEEIIKVGGKPFIVPAMGSHGGATAEGQARVLESFGICERTMGVPVVSSMETVGVCKYKKDVTLHFDKHAYRADAIVVINRIKAHTDFNGPVESGLSKMVTIGLGKHKGASLLHQLGFDNFHEVIPEAAQLLIENTPIALGAAILENAYHDVVDVEILPAEEISEREPLLCKKAKEFMPSLPFADLDVLYIDEIGKNISGSGLDTNIVGRKVGIVEPKINKIIVGDITAESYGNATGIGLADITTQKCLQKIDFTSMYLNCITSTDLRGVKIPLVAESDQQALEIACQTSNQPNLEKLKVVRIKNTLSLETFFVSRALLPEIEQLEGIQVVGDPVKFEFNQNGYLS
ncbi:lactate racemase domain-containing protein [Oceanobacillus sp. FSL W7-1293]|uniref:lactate racemase domain-containing protein n=1 Tax=Oceanobacillus sp. FSL W7-1293 TaxID=2921699 RepID=UPI0030CC9E1D